MNNINAIKFISEGASTISLAKIGEPPSVSLEYSYNGVDWSNWDFSNLTVNSGDTLYIRGNNPSGFSSFSDNCYSFVIEGDKVNCSGNIMSLIDYKNLPDVIPCDYCYSNMFFGCSALTTAPELPATKLTDGCYYQMFSGCTSLKTAPELPAVELSEYCYSYMFFGCSALTTAPELSAKGLAYSCYHRMFTGCTSLKTTHDISAKGPVYSYGNLMVELC